MPNRLPRKLLLAFIVLMLLWSGMSVFPLLFPDLPVRFVAEFYDRAAYYERGQWFTAGPPAISEYPQLPTLLFGVNNLFALPFPPAVRFLAYAAFFSLWMMLALLAVIKLLARHLPPARQNLAFLMLLPPVVYYTYNRFDILPALLCLLAWLATARRRWGWAGVWLALGAFTKWVPILLLPALFLYARRVSGRWPGRMLAGFAAASALALASTAILGGWPALFAPYQFHFARPAEPAALPVILAGGEMGLLFLVLQFAGVGLSLSLHADTPEDLPDIFLVILGPFVLFSSIYSPQWFLWLMPFLILGIRTRADLWLVIAYAFAAYLGFPWMYDLYGVASPLLQAASLLWNGLLAVLLWRAARRLQFGWPPLVGHKGQSVGQ